MTTFQVTDHDGFLATAVDALRRTLARSWQVQNWLGLASVSDPENTAYAQITAFSADPPADGERYSEDEIITKRPRVFIDLHPETPIILQRTSTTNYETSGGLVVNMERDLVSDEDAQPLVLAQNLSKSAGRMLEEVMSSSNSDATLAITSINITDFGRIDVRDAPQQWPRAVIELEVFWGTNRG